MSTITLPPSREEKTPVLTATDIFLRDAEKLEQDLASKNMSLNEVPMAQAISNVTK